MKTKKIKSGFYLHDRMDLVVEVGEDLKFWSVKPDEWSYWVYLDSSIYGAFSNKTFPEDFTYIGEVGK